MWMLDPSILCSNHLNGEWHELFMIVGHLQRKRKVDKYITNNCLELRSIQTRYAEIKREKQKRNHKKFKPLSLDFDISYLPLEQQNYKVDRERSLLDLLNRCEKCLKRYNEINKKKEVLLLNREVIFREERWQRKRLRILLSLDWNVVRKRLKRRTPRLRTEEGKR